MIKFWRTTDEYGALSNFAHFGFMLDEVYWPTSEHYYQAQKTRNSELQTIIRKATTPKKCKQIACQIELREDWENIKYDVMLTALRAKFNQSKSLKELLINTGDEELVEASPYDYIWGCGADGSGKNLLGRALMEIRTELKEAKKD